MTPPPALPSDQTNTDTAAKEKCLWDTASASPSRTEQGGFGKKGSELDRAQVLGRSDMQHHRYSYLQMFSFFGTESNVAPFVSLSYFKQVKTPWDKNKKREIKKKLGSEATPAVQSPLPYIAMLPTMAEC